MNAIRHVLCQCTIYSLFQATECHLPLSTQHKLSKLKILVFKFFVVGQLVNIIQVGFTLSQATKALRESRGIAILYFRPRHQKGVKGQRHAPAAPYPRETPGTHCTGGWVGLRTGLDRCRKSRPHQDSIPGPSSPQAVAIPTTLPGPFKYYIMPIFTCCTPWSRIFLGNNENEWCGFKTSPCSPTVLTVHTFRSVKNVNITIKETNRRNEIYSINNN